MPDTRFFYIVGANDDDNKQILNILHNKTFYPEKTSVPPLPDEYDDSFDYRQFFINLNLYYMGYPIVYTREEMEETDFNTSIIPEDDWTERYRLSEAPTIVEMHENAPNLIKNRTTLYSFLSYDYQLVNNK